MIHHFKKTWAKNIAMKKHIAVFFIFLFLFAAPVFSQISVMSYNIRYDNPSDDKNSWQYRRKELAAMIQYYAPEIVGVQEALHTQVKYLDSILKGYSYVGVGREDGKTKGEYAAIFYKKSHIRMLSTKTFWLSKTPDKVSVGWDAVTERIATFASFENRKTKDTLYVFNCHFDHIGKVARKESAVLLLKIIKNKKLSSKKVVVMGDLNAIADSEAIAVLKTQMQDFYDKKNVVTYGPLGTFNQFDTQAPAQKRIDYILVRNIEVLQYVHIDDRRKNNLLLSDHLPVMIQIK